ncbi:hypothetical protein ACFLT2_12480 [Acidobacteriota bacterium]
MKIQVLKFLFLVVVVSAVAFGCGGGKEQSSPVETAERQVAPKVEKSSELSPTELGQKIADLYAKAMTDLTDMLKEKPSVDEVQSKVKVMKEDYVAKLVEFGRKREALDASGKATVDSKLRMKMSSLYKDPVFTDFNEIQKHYFQNKEFHKIVMSFNIITQYADFDLLKKQDPEEAERLGIQ